MSKSIEENNINKIYFCDELLNIHVNIPFMILLSFIFFFSFLNFQPPPPLSQPTNKYLWMTGVEKLFD